MTINDIPDEVLRWIFLVLDPTSYFNVSQVCRKWRNVCRDDQILREHVNQWFTSEQDQSHRKHLLQVKKDCWKLPNEENCYSECERSIYLPLIKQQRLYEFFFPTHRIFFTKDIGNCNSSDCRATEFVVSQDGTKILFVSVSKSSDHTMRLDLYDVSGKDPIKRWSTSRRLGYEPVGSYMSSGGDYIATSYLSGHVEVIRLLPGGTFKRVFFKQFPSGVQYIAVSKNGQVMFCRFTRLGGLILINLQTGEERDIGHYRMDLKMQLQYYDKVLSLPGYSETVMFGGGKRHLHNHVDIDPDIDLWDYYKQLTRLNESFYVPLERAVALGVPNWYLGFLGSDLQLWKRDEDEETECKECQSENNINSTEAIHNRDVNGVDKSIQTELEQRQHFHNEDDEEGITIPCYSFNDSHEDVTSYDISHSADKVVIRKPDGKLVLIRLTAKTIDTSLKLDLLPVREIALHGLTETIDKVFILSNDRILLVTTFCLIICKLSRAIEPCEYFLLHEIEGLRHFINDHAANTVYI